MCTASPVRIARAVVLPRLAGIGKTSRTASRSACVGAKKVPTSICEPSKRNTPPLTAPQIRIALSAIASKVGCTSVGDDERTRRISAVAVCCSNASRVSLNEARVLHCDYRLRGKIFEQRDPGNYLLPGPHTLYCTRNQKGNFRVGMRTEKSRLRRSLTSLQELMQRIRHHAISEQVGEINAALRGHYAYYGVAGNLRSLVKVYRVVERYWRRMLCSRSWAGRRLT